MSSCLLTNILIRDLDTQELVLNSNEPLFVLIRETDLMSQMGLEVPAVAKAALYQQNTVKQHRCSLEVRTPSFHLFVSLKIHPYSDFPNPK